MPISSITAASSAGGVFYENGSGNYRTYNEFNNEFFRGDGSLVYNGGGIAHAIPIKTVFIRKAASVPVC